MAMREAAKATFDCRQVCEQFERCRRPVWGSPFDAVRAGHTLQREAAVGFAHARVLVESVSSRFYARHFARPGGRDRVQRWRERLVVAEILCAEMTGKRWQTQAEAHLLRAGS